MVDKTQEDFDLEKRLDALEKATRVLSKQIDSIHMTFDSWTVTVHQHDRLFKALNPLEALVVYVDGIKEFFDSWRKGFVK